jgi:2-polyprenyl-3-methyl-5-hydroxy-6-metoxy-1,4-benzoquinol methylase
MAAFGYVSYEPRSEHYWLDEEQRAVLLDESSPYFATGTFQFTGASLLHTEELLRVFRQGGGIPYRRLHPDIAGSIDRMHRSWFDHLLTGHWIPEMPGVEAKLQAGIDVLDVGCGLGRSTQALARVYPSSRITGVDPHRPSVAAARTRAAAAGLANVEFVESTLEALPGDRRFDLILAIDCIHDMADPVGALRAARERLADDGLLVWSEPTGSTNPLENTAPLPRLRAALSSYHCLTVSLAVGGPGLGTLLGLDLARELARQAGFPAFELLPVQSETQLFFGLRKVE